MTLPLPSTFNVSETVFIAIPLLFFAIWGYRHGLDAAILAGLVVLFGRVAAPVLATPVATIVNVLYGTVMLILSRQFSVENLAGVIRGDSTILKPLVNVKDPNDTWMVAVTIAIFVAIAFFGFWFAVKRAGGKDTFIESLFGLIGAAVVGYICVTFVLDRLLSIPQTLVIGPSQIPQISVNASLIVAIVLVLIVFGFQRSKPPAKKG